MVQAEPTAKPRRRLSIRGTQIHGALQESRAGIQALHEAWARQADQLQGADEQLDLASLPKLRVILSSRWNRCIAIRWLG